METDGRLLRSQATRQALIEAARQVFLTKGYKGATVDDITRLAGVAHGTFYTHFAGKDNILIHALDDLIAAFYAVQEQEPFEPRTVTEARAIVRSEMATFVHLGLEWQPLMRVLLDALRDSETVRRYWQEEVELRLIRRAEQDERYAQAHDLAKPLDARIVSRAIIALATHFQWLFVQGVLPPEELDQTIDTLVDLYMHGMYEPGC